MKSFALRATLNILLPLVVMLTAITYGLYYFGKAQYNLILNDFNSLTVVNYKQFTAHLDFTDDETIKQRLLFEVEVTSESINSLTLYFPESLQSLSVSDHNWDTKKPSTLFPKLFSTACVWLEVNKTDWFQGIEFECLAASLARVEFQLDRTYLNAETLNFEVNLELRNELKQISDYHNQQIAIRQQGHEIFDNETQLANWKGQLLPMGMGVINFTEIMVKQNESNKLLLAGELHENSESTFHISRSNAGLSFFSNVIYGQGMELVKHSRNGLDVYFIYHESQRKNPFREQRTIELILLTFDYFESILPYPDTYYWVDFATNINLGGGYAYGHGTSISTRETFNDWLIVHEVVHQWTCTLITYCESLNYIVQESLTEYLTTKILQKSGLLTGHSAYWNDSTNRFITHTNPEYFHGKVATDLSVEVVYAKNLSLFYRLEMIYGEKAFLSAIMDYLGVNAAGAKQGVKMSNDSFISHLNERFPEHKTTLNHLLTSSEAFEFSLANLVQTEQGWQYGIALDYQEFTSGLSVNHAFEPWIEIEIENNQQPITMTGCNLTNDGCAIVIPYEVEHTCIVVDPKNRYLALNGYNNRFCIEQYAMQTP